jgi:hypothetical protein
MDLNIKKIGEAGYYTAKKNNSEFIGITKNNLRISYFITYNYLYCYYMGGYYSIPIIYVNMSNIIGFILDNFNDPYLFISKESEVNI